MAQATSSAHDDSGAGEDALPNPPHREQHFWQGSIRRQRNGEAASDSGKGKPTASRKTGTRRDQRLATRDALEEDSTTGGGYDLENNQRGAGLNQRDQEREGGRKARGLKT